MATTSAVSQAPRASTRRESRRRALGISRVSDVMGGVAMCGVASPSAAVHSSGAPTGLYADRPNCMASSPSGGAKPANPGRDHLRARLWQNAASNPRRTPARGTPMAYVITEPCIGTKDNSCVEVCPVDCIHPTPDEPDYDSVEMLYIDPEECIDCDACVEACPVDACFAEDQVPDEWQKFVQINADYFKKA